MGNDAYVMSAWGRKHKAEGKVRMLADPRGEFVKALDLELNTVPVLGKIGSKRYCMLIEDGKIMHIGRADGAFAKEIMFKLGFASVWPRSRGKRKPKTTTLRNTLSSNNTVASRRAAAARAKKDKA